MLVAGQTQLLAGASLPIAAGIANVMQFASLELADAIRMAVDHPARLLGLEPGGLAQGGPADLVIFKLAPVDGALKIEPLATMLAGELLSASVSQPPDFHRTG
jgi:N-acetylglucosamine-6-phosphate deacetylase